jgi:Flp pilus assembly secretin CpaC
MTAKLSASAVALGLALLLTTISATRAADQTITLTLGIRSALALERSFRTVLIGDPNVVNVHTHNDRSVILEPLNLGATNLVFVDERSIAITNVTILVCNPGAI